ncbi:putative nuclease HARBI1 [Diabrotica virgifera virgifera]|uniref:DDE Tnp4 domain-containing protein n=1 Tax=Diabrotica virgifera virgifera TaxID=50390 RepID=A0ABM5KBE9_DIAVI|nr:putative nuclease HARBI1 [Diabrotica virgifera virgifera]
MSRCIDEVTEVIYGHITPNWIKFPNSEHSRNTVSNGFRRRYNFPQCLGAIDCTHIAIISPPENYPALPYYCRKGYYSINCQIVVDSKYNILNMNARFPGSTHDSAIWQASNIKTIMENLYIGGANYFLIGDSGYPLQPFLLTPFENPQENTPESNYNYHFIRSRNVVEKLNGVLKSRFRCLLKHRALNYNPIKAGKIIYSCGALHNIANFYKDEVPEEGDDVEPDNENDIDIIENRPVDHNWYRRGEQIRAGIVQQYFNIL